ncbi:response regulator [Geomonas anaerohicana]|uniref:Response regulator n=1 Tax=Geomonas anaerohicana TaxID=2798583 RepID=A0ABS0YIC0_9BACT|nr:response regulator [Geomonas anaerohicana]MBJ6752050.1 response regulator [Geomonas anaerohicana]
MTEVLVVEDNVDNLRLITYALQRGGYRVVSADSGTSGVELALSMNPAFIIMDINLPDFDGLEATRRIRSSEAHGKVPIIAITSYAMAGDMDKVLEAGCNGYFEKPIDPLTILDKIHALLRSMPPVRHQDEARP